MNIGEASRRSSVSAKMIRYYEDIGLLQQSRRSQSGYRVYSEHEVHVLQFLKLARNTGFSVPEIRDMLSLWQDPTRSASKVRVRAQAYVKELEQRIDDATEMRDTLNQLAQARACHPKHP